MPRVEDLIERKQLDLIDRKNADMREMRCGNCKRLLCKMGTGAPVEIKCYRCNHTTCCYFSE